MPDQTISGLDTNTRAGIIQWLRDNEAALNQSGYAVDWGAIKNMPEYPPAMADFFGKYVLVDAPRTAKRKGDRRPVRIK